MAKSSLGYNPLGDESQDVSLRELVGKPSEREAEEAPRPAALILGGLGAEAAAEPGVIEALVDGSSPATGKASFRPEIVVGSSFGSFNAALLAARWRRGPSKAVAKLKEVWRDRLAESSGRPGNGVFRFRGDPLDLMNLERFLERPFEPFTELAEDGVFFARDWLSRGRDFARSSANLSQRFFAMPDLATLVSTEPFADLLEDLLEKADLRATDLELFVVASAWESEKPRVFARGRLAGSGGRDRLRGAIALPGIFPAVEVDGEHLLDGSTMCDPLAPALERGAGELHVVEPTLRPEDSERECSTLEVLNRSARRQARAVLEGSLARIDRWNQVALRESRPPIVVHRHRPQLKRNDTPSVLDFSTDRIGSAISEGRRAAAAHDCHEAGCLGVGRS